MLPLIEQNRDQIIRLCERFGVERLELFGSAAAGTFNPETSDLDFFVEFRDYHCPQVVDNWFGFQEHLEVLFGRKVDIVSIKAAKNPYFLRMANQHRIPLYAA